MTAILEMQERFVTPVRPQRPARPSEQRDANTRAVPYNLVPNRCVSLWEEMLPTWRGPAHSSELLAFAEDLKAYAELAGRREAVRRWRGLTPYESD
jgi:hypothetical protein